MKRMKRFAQKGASIAIALVIFLLLSLGGATALTMASANAGRYSHADENRQAYYTVSSAALLMADLLDGMTYRSAAAEQTYLCETIYREDGEGGPQRETKETYALNFLDGDAYDAEKGYPLIGAAERAGVLTLPARGEEGADAERQALEKSTLLGAIRARCDEVVPYRSVPQTWYAAADGSGKTTAEGFMPAADLTFSFTVRTETEGFEEVTATLAMGADYDLLFTFALKEGETVVFAASFSWAATVDEAVEEGETRRTYTESGEVFSIETVRSAVTTVTWNKANVTFMQGEGA